MNYEWKIKNAPDNLIEEYMQKLHISRILATGLINNNVSIDVADMIFNAIDYERLYKPLNIARIHEAALLLKEYLSQPNTLIQIFADYDTDGNTSAAIACKVLRKSGEPLQRETPNITYYIPERKNGYGLSVAFAEQFINFADQCPDLKILVLTVDNGITAKPAIDILKQKPNIEVLVTDHHEPDYENGLTPTTECICVDPHLDKQSEGEFLAGCGVIFNVLQELENICGLNNKFTKQMYYLAAIGTIGDMMHLDLYHACLVQLGLFQLNMLDTVYWIQYIKNQVKINNFVAKDIAFTISPIINACGQMGNAALAFDMLIAEDEAEGLAKAEQAYQLYQANKSETKTARDAVEIDILENYISNHPFIMYPMPTNRPGLVSKVATHIAKQIGMPIILWAETEENQNDEIITGSARNDTSIPVLNIMREAVKNGLADAAEGHAYAFGVKLFRSKLTELQEFLDEKIRSYGRDIGAGEGRSLTVDCVISTNDINVKNMKELEAFPFAKNLVAPVVMIKEAKICGVKVSKNNAKNVCYTIQSPDAAYPIDIWAWNIKPDAYDATKHTKIDMIGTIERNFMKPDFATLSVLDLRCY